MIRTERLTKEYPLRKFDRRRFRWVKAPIRAVDGLDLEVEEGEIFAIMGPNGAGKSTTIRLLSGITRPTSGCIEVGGVDMVRRGPAAKFRVGYMPEKPGFDPRLNARRVLGYYGRFYGLGGIPLKRRIDELLKLVDLEKDANRPVDL